MIRVRLATLGCKANHADSEALADALGPDVRLVGDGEPADVVVVNSCTVTHTADADARQLVRRTRSELPSARIVVTGCYATVGRAELAARPEVDHVVPNADKARLPALISGGSAFTLRDAAAIRALPQGRTRPFVKVQDGCDYVCSFCIIPAARGASRSLDVGAVADTVARYEDLGALEVVLTGIHLGHWGKDMAPRRRFADLVAELVRRTRHVRFRISSLEPGEVDDAVLDLLDDTARVCPHLHVPLQSGDDAILSRMRRVYRASHYAQLVERFRRRVPRGAWGIDVMVGFPGEDDRSFRRTADFLESLDFTYLHVFPYSPRQGTEAATMAGQVPADVKRARCRALLALSEARRAAHAERSVGEVVTVLAEGGYDQGRLRGFSEHYLSVTFEGPREWTRTMRRVKIVAADGGAVRGTVHESD